MSYSLPYTGLETEELLNNVPNDSTLATLTTTDKTIVGAINEVDVEITENKYTSLDNEGAVIPLHASAIEGNLDVTLQGKTYTNIVENGDFEDGTTNWTAGGATIAVANNILTMSNEAGFATPNLSQDTIPYTPGDNIYLTSYIKPIAEIPNSVEIRAYGSITTGTIVVADSVANPSLNITKYLSGIVTVPSDGSGLLKIAIKAIYGDSLIGKVIEIQEVMAINLTALNETETDLDILAAKYPYINGTKSVSPQKVSSVGKNLFDGVFEEDYSISGSTGELTPSAGWKSSLNYIKCSPNTEYRLSKSAYSYVYYYDENKNYLGISVRSDLPNGDKTLTTSDFASYLRFNLDDIADTDIQLELGSSSTTHEPYKETHLYTTDELSGLPNGVRDERNLLSGEKVQRIGINIFDGTKNWLDLGGGEFILKSDGFSQLFKTFSSLICTHFPDSNVNGLYFGSLGIAFSAGATSAIGVTTVAELKAYLAAEYAASTPVTVWYELAIPITTQLPPQLLKSEKSGTLYVEQKIEDFGFYGSNFIILDTNYPITALTEVVKVNTQTGEETTLDLDNCTIAGDGLSFTCTDLVSGDFVRCEFEYTPAGAPPTVDYIVSTTLKGQVNDNSDGVKYLNKKIVSNELEVATKANKTQEDWIEPTLLNSWVNISGKTTKFFKDEFGIVNITANIKDGTATLETVIFTLPVGYRPANNIILVGERSNDASISLFLVTPVGSVLIRANTGVGSFVFNGSFRADN